MKVLLQNDSGLRKEVKQGFSWTTFFFGGFVPLFRGDLKWFIIMWILALISFGISWLVMPFIYNKKYMEGLMMKGFKVVN
ncbi:DUF2628 domain-containing protein [Clostridium sardiniense]|uniref:DUF2628 domain-containing protein n=1 Tax=Clostridium sardiniense TaxID=29369 RepID=UPI003D3465C0